MIRRLFAAGCSFTDHTTDQGIDPDRMQPYGQLLATQLGVDYWHEAAACGSNHRIWRRCATHVLDGNLTAQDLLLVQYTEYTRQEFWSARPWTLQCYPRHLVEPGPDQGSVIRYKQGAQAWQQHAENRDLFRAYEQDFVNLNWCQQQWRVQHAGFQHLLRHHHIRVVFLKTRAYAWGHDQLLPDFAAWAFAEPPEDARDPLSYIADGWHLSQRGHDLLCKRLLHHLQGLGWA